MRLFEILGAGGIFLALILWAGPAAGGDAAPDPFHDWSLLDLFDGESLGWFGQTAGDFDGDGHDDVIVGDLTYDSGNGAAFIFGGSPTGLPGSGAPPQADLSDALWLAVGSGNNLGWHVAAAGDVNGDGEDDVLVRSLNGEVHAYYGTSFPSGVPASPDWKLVGCSASFSSGITATTAGDVDADGYDDVLIHCGSDVAVFRGGPSGLESCALDDCSVGEADWRLTEPMPPTEQRYGFPAGDVNGDGFDDVIVTFLESPVSALVFHGPLSGTATGLDADWVFASGNFLKLGPGGDVDCDGFDDVVIQDTSGPGALTVGQVHVFLGSDAGLKACAGPCDADDADWTVAGVDNPAKGDHLIFIGFPGIVDDFGGDGHDDLIVTTQFNQDAPAHPGTGEPGVGVFFGSPDGLPNCAGTDPPSCLITDAPWVVSLGSTLPLAGGNVFAAGAGDVNGDNGLDLIVSYPFASGGGTSFVYHGYPDLDGDGFSVEGGDCNDGAAETYPGALESLDGVDNQCPTDKNGDPDSGYGVVDEITPSPDTFTGPPESGELCWTAQPAATEYEIAASRLRTFGPTPAEAGCSSIRVKSFTCFSGQCCVDAGFDPRPGELFHFLARGSQPLEGSWGLGGSPPAPRDACEDNVVENGDFEFGQCFGGFVQLNTGSQIPVEGGGNYGGNLWHVQGPVELSCENVFWESASGSRDVTLLNFGSVRQSLDVQPGEPYTVTFALGATDSSTGQVMLEVAADTNGDFFFENPVTYIFQVPPGGFDGTPDQWQFETYSFTASNPLAAIRLLGLTSAGGAPVVDKVTVSSP